MYPHASKSRMHLPLTGSQRNPLNQCLDKSGWHSLKHGRTLLKCMINGQDIGEKFQIMERQLTEVVDKKVNSSFKTT